MFSLISNYNKLISSHSFNLCIYLIRVAGGGGGTVGHRGAKLADISESGEGGTADHKGAKLVP